MPVMWLDIVYNGTFFRLEAKKCPVIMVADVCADSNVRNISVLPVSIVVVFSV